ncbi:MAG: glycosyltransferase, partial [Methylotenera sp.]
NNIVNKNKVSRIPGSGINLEVFSFNKPVAASANTFTFLLLARLLWDKGVGEYVEAAKSIKQKFPNVKFQLLGFLDVKNPTAISQSQLNQWVENGLVEYLGVTDDVKPYLILADCIVLPSYREGVPRTLLEAAAIGRPIVASDVPGCKDVVTHGKNGFLCNVKDSTDLTEKMQDMILLPYQHRLEFAMQGRLKIEAEFDENIVIKKYLDVIDNLIG